LRGLQDAQFAVLAKRILALSSPGELLSDFYALALFNFHKFNDSKTRQIRPKGKVVRSFYKPANIAEFIKIYGGS